MYDNTVGATAALGFLPGGQHTNKYRALMAGSNRLASTDTQSTGLGPPGRGRSSAAGIDRMHDLLIGTTRICSPGSCNRLVPPPVHGLPAPSPPLVTGVREN